MQAYGFRHAILVLHVLLAFGAMTVRSEEIWKNEPLELKEIVAYAAVANFKGLLATADKVAAVNVPKEFYKPGMILPLVGAVLGDPELKSIGTKPIVGALFKSVENDVGSQYALYVPAGTATQGVEDAFRARDLFTLVQQEVVIVAPSETVLARARDAFGEYKTIAASKIAADVRLYIDIQRAMEPHREAFDKGIREVLEKSEKNFSKDLEGLDVKLDPKFFLGMAYLGTAFVEGCVKQSERAQIDITITPEALALDTYFAAKEDSVIGAFLSGAAPEPDPKMRALLCNGGETWRTGYNSAAMVAALKRLRDELAANPHLKEYADSDLMLGMIEETESRGGETLSGGITPFGEIPVILNTVNDEKKYLAARKKKSTFLAPESALGKLITAIGGRMEAKFEKTGRTHRGAAIYKEDLVMDLTNVKPMFKAMMKAPGEGQEVHTEAALVGNIFVESADADDLIQMIDRISDRKQAEKPYVLKSEQHFGKGKQFYWEADLIGDEQVDDKELIGKPMMLALGFDKGRAKLQFHMTYKPVAHTAVQFLKMMGLIQQPKTPETNDGKF